MATLGMIGGVRGPNDYWQSLDGSGRAHAANPAYKDYSQLYREYTFEPKPGYVPVGERDGKTVYAAPDYMRDEAGNYVPISAADVERIASETNAIIPTREEVKNLYGQAEHLTMPTFANGIGDSAAYTSALNLEEVTGPIVHGKEFFAEGESGRPLSDMDSALSMIRQFEGFRTTPYWDVNALRTGYGSDTITRADGSVVAVTSGMEVSREDAERDLARRVETEFMPSARNAVGDDAWNSLNPAQKGALTSLAYNYGAGAWGGSLANVAAAVRSGDMAGAERAIRALASHNGGVNSDRRNTEADVFVNGMPSDWANYRPSASNSGTYVPMRGNMPMTGTGGDPEVVGGEEDDRIQWDFTPEEQASLYEAYMSGALTGAARQSYEDGVRAGAIVTPQPIEGVSTPYTPEERAALDEAYQSGTMPPEARQAYETAFPEAAAQAATPEPTARAGSMSQAAPPENIAVAPPRAEVQDAQAAELASAPPRGNNGFDLTREYGSEAGGDLMVAAAPGVFGGRNEGVVDWPNLPGIVERGADAGLTALGALGGFGGAAAGLVGDAVELAGVNSGYADRVARDLAAVPEAFAGTPFMFPARQPRPGPTREAARALDDVEARAEPPMTRGDIPGQLPAPAALSEAETNKMRQLIAKAANNNAAAREELAQMARVNSEARAAAERLGITVPADVFATDPAVQQAYGLIRSVKSSDAAAEWQTAFEDAQQRALDVLKADGATLDLAGTSERIRDDLQGTIDVLRSDAGQVFDEVRDAVPTGARVRPDATTRALNNVITELGGDESLPGPVKKLLAAVTSDQGMTYGRIMQERAQIGRAAFKSQGPYADADQRTLKALYAALGEDQRAFVAAEVGEDAAVKLDAANELWTAAKEIEDRLVAGFGKDVTGSLAPTLRSIITRGGKGDIQPLNKALSVIPGPLQREAVLTALADASMANSAQGGFSFANYAKAYAGLRNNSPVYSRIAKVVGPETEKLMRDLYEVSVRMDRATNNVPRTGQSNQALIMEGLMSDMLNSPPGKYVRSAVAATAGNIIGGPLLGGVFATAAQGGKIGRNRPQVVSALLRSEAFQKMMIEAAKTGTVTEQAQRRVTNSPQFRRWAKASGITDPNAWLAASIAANTANRETADAQ